MRKLKNHPAKRLEPAGHRRPRRRHALVGYQRTTADGRAVLAYATKLPIGRLSNSLCVVATRD